MESANNKNLNGYEKLVVGYTNALQLNSDIIVQTLNELTKKELSEKDKRTLRALSKTLNKIDKNLEDM